MSASITNKKKLEELYLSLKLDIYTDKDINFILSLYDDNFYLERYIFSNSTAYIYYNSKILQFIQENRDKLKMKEKHKNKFMKCILKEGELKIVEKFEELIHSYNNNEIKHKEVKIKKYLARISNINYFSAKLYFDLFLIKMYFTIERDDFFDKINKFINFRKFRNLKTGKILNSTDIKSEIFNNKTIYNINLIENNEFTFLVYFFNQIFCVLDNLPTNPIDKDLKSVIQNKKLLIEQVLDWMIDNWYFFIKVQKEKKNKDKMLNLFKILLNYSEEFSNKTQGDIIFIISSLFNVDFSELKELKNLIALKNNNEDTYYHRAVEAFRLKWKIFKFKDKEIIKKKTIKNSFKELIYTLLKSINCLRKSYIFEEEKHSNKKTEINSLMLQNSNFPFYVKFLKTVNPKEESPEQIIKKLNKTNKRQLLYFEELYKINFENWNIIVYYCDENEFSKWENNEYLKGVIVIKNIEEKFLYIKNLFCNKIWYDIKNNKYIEEIKLESNNKLLLMFHNKKKEKLQNDFIDLYSKISKGDQEDQEHLFYIFLSIFIEYPILFKVYASNINQLIASPTKINDKFIEFFMNLVNFDSKFKIFKKELSEKILNNTFKFFIEKFKDNGKLDQLKHYYITESQKIEINSVD